MITIVKDRAYLDLSMLRRPSSTRKLVGEVFLTGPSFSKCRLELTIREKPPVELCPNYLVFGSTNNAAVSATAIVRVNATKPGNEVDSISVTCTLPSGKLLESSISKLSNGIFRIELEIQKSEATEFRSSGVDIAMRFKSSTLDELVIGNSRFVW